MRPYRVILPLLTAVAFALLPSAAASAVPYPAEPPPANSSASTVVEGGSVTVTGTGFIPGELVDVSFACESSEENAAYTGGGAVVLAGFAVQVPAALPQMLVRTLRADSNGTVTASVKLSEACDGVITLFGRTSKVSHEVPVDVLDSDSADTLPTTGTDSNGLWIAILSGLAAVGVGGALVWWALVWRRRSVDTPAEG